MAGRFGIAVSILLAATTEVRAQRGEPAATPAKPETYLLELGGLLQKKWPGNRTVNIVCHGHSVPAGYFKTPVVDTFNAYPALLHRELKNRHPHAVLNVIVTAIGGETSETGAARFQKDVLTHRPDLVTIDYALNDRRLGLEKSRKNLAAMIDLADANKVRVILLTPTGDTSAKLDDPNDPLNQQAAMIRELAQARGVGLADSWAAFQRHVQDGGQLTDLMSQVNHPNRKGHDLVVAELLKWFVK